MLDLNVHIPNSQEVKSIVDGKQATIKVNTT